MAAQGTTVIAACVDSEEKTLEVGEKLNFPIAYGVTRDQGDAIGAWWEERRDHIQPSEFVLSGSGRVMMSTYSNSPIGRMDPDEALTLLTFLNEMRKKKS